QGLRSHGPRWPVRCVGRQRGIGEGSAMSASDGRPGTSRAFAFGALALAWALYVPYFFLPVTGPAPWGEPDSSMTGVLTFPALRRVAVSLACRSRACPVLGWLGVTGAALVAWGSRCRTVVARCEPCDGGIVMASVHWDVLQVVSNDGARRVRNRGGCCS